MPIEDRRPIPPTQRALCLLTKRRIAWQGDAGQVIGGYLIHICVRKKANWLRQLNLLNEKGNGRGEQFFAGAGREFSLVWRLATRRENGIPPAEAPDWTGVLYARY